MEGLFTVEEPNTDSFAVNLDVFSGPFSVLLDLISRRRLDVTDVALAAVTDEFIAFVRAQDTYNLSQVSEFLVVAATLLELKAARLLPGGDLEEEDPELLEQRDLLFAKLLQYKAYKQVASVFAQRMAECARSYGRDATIDTEYLDIVPPTHITIGVEDLAIMAAAAFSRDPEIPTVTIDHLHTPVVPVRSQVTYLRENLKLAQKTDFAKLCKEAPNMATVIARFMAVLELIRANEIDAYQEESLAPLTLVKTRESTRELEGIVDEEDTPGDHDETPTLDMENISSDNDSEEQQ
ncbi:MAG: segregation/condensation protein A [Actinomycetaceae bacterium]|nr:segregation/condensation protein A [Actinomycetaceae bacterium]